MPCFHSETNEWSEDWQKQWNAGWSVATSWEIHLSSEKNRFCCPKFARHFNQPFDSFLTLKLSWYCKSGSTFPSSKLFAACNDLCLLGNTRFCACPSNPRKLCWSAAQSAQYLHLQLTYKNSIFKISAHETPLKLVGLAAEFKFESKLEPLHHLTMTLEGSWWYR